MPRKKTEDEEELTGAELAAAEVNAKFLRAVGTPVVQHGYDALNAYMLRRPTGIVSLDIVIGGGWPAGALVQVAGPEGSGKNALCCQTAATVQKNYKKLANIGWVPIEIHYDKIQGRMFNLIVGLSDNEVSFMNMIRKSQGKKPLSKKRVRELKRTVGNFFIVGAGSCEHQLQATVDLTASNQFQLIVVDSVAALLTEQRDDKDLGEEPQQSSEARLLTDFTKKLRGAHCRTGDDVANWTTVIVTNQIRANRSTAKIKRPWTVGGAHALRHAKLIDVWVTSGERIPKDTSKPKEGKIIRWEIAKGKAGCHEGPKGEIPFYFGGDHPGFDVALDAVNTAARMGILVQRGKYWHLVNSEGDTEEKFPGGRQAVIDEARRDPDLYDYLYSAVVKKAEIPCLYKL